MPTHLEQDLQLRSAALGRPASERIRVAWQAYLGETRAAPSSAYALGEDLFGRHRGPVDLATDRKALVAAVWAAKHARRAPKARRGDPR